MRISIILLGSVSLFLFSCQKEAEFANKDNGGNGNNNTDELLVKMVAKTGLDSMVTTFAYNTNKKLVLERKTGTDDQGNSVNTEYHFHRNASGIITDYSTIDPDLIAQGIDSIPTIVHYNSSRYTSYVISISIPGFTLLDSGAYVYDGSGKITEEDFYESPSGSGNDYYLSGKVNYSYASNGNISGLTVHDFDQSGAEVFTANTTNIDYDSKTNALYMDNEAFILGHPEWTSPNNIVSEQLSDSNGPVDDQSVTIAYTYNNHNRPETGVAAVLPDNTVSHNSYYYQ